MRATEKYFWIVTALMLVQVGMGAITAHYGVEGQAFFGFPLAEYLPTRCRGAGTFNWPFSGLPRPGWQQVCSLPRRFRATSQNFSDWA
ncbi:hypothetical protein [Spirosoma telluris]|uniref:hypothetical protein n=1 Tax=Spirosoma telluris TaxID=2183553 RepID=UPI002FC27E86